MCAPMMMVCVIQERLDSCKLPKVDGDDCTYPGTLDGSCLGGVCVPVGCGDGRIDGAEAVGAHKTSMLQDVEARRKLEVEALIGAVIELGRLTNTPSAPRFGSRHGATCRSIRSARSPT